MSSATVASRSGRSADKIVVLEAGRVSQFGSHSELIERPGLYRELVEICSLIREAAINVLVLAPEIRARGEHFDLAHQASTVLWSVILVGGIVLLVMGPTARRRASGGP